ncbi:MAG: AAA domain-containing protein [Planctomycetota bacterium]
MSSRRRKKFSTAESEKHFVDMVTWLAMESQAEVQRMDERRKKQNQRDAEKSGETILDLIIADHETGLGGQKLVTFKRKSAAKAMPWHRLRVGAPVVVSAFPIGGQSETGVVSKRLSDAIQVSMNRWPEADVFRVDLTADEVTRQRQLKAIMSAKDAKGRLGKLRDVMMGELEPTFLPPERSQPITFRTQLNETQQAAIEFALNANDLAVIHGPPGTGKTTTVAELICQAIATGDRVLACAPSNTAVDNLLERLIQLDQRVVRIGHPARVGEDLRKYTLDGLVDEHESTEIIREMRREAESLFRQSDKWTRAKRTRGDRQELRREAKQLLFNARTLERQAIEFILDDADVICATTTFNEDLLGDRKFDMVVIDEACQSTEPGCWIPLARSQRIVLAGDHQQLPPTVLSKQAADEGFAISLMERQIEQWGPTISRMLGVQYRMHRDIMAFSSEQFYDDELRSHESVIEHRLCDLPDVEESEFTREIFTFIDSAGAAWDEELEPEGLSKRNPNEARLVLHEVQRLLEAGVAPSEIAVIAPYAAQVRLIRDLYEGDGLEIDTVDGFQGREKEAVIISMVRSNAKNEIGFLADRRRMNVALTRARRKLVVIGDSGTLGIDPFYQSFLEYIDNNGTYRTVWEFEL